MQTLVGWSTFAAALAAVWAFQIFAVPWINPYHTSLAVLSLIWMTATVGLAVVLGFTGQFSLGHAGFMAVGGYTAAYLNHDVGVDPGLAIVAGGATAALAGLAVGIPTLRLSGDYLAIVTLGFNGIILNVINNVDALGGATGIIGLPQWTHFGWAGTALVVATAATRNLVWSTHGRLFIAARDNEIALRSLGLDTTRVKATAFVVGALWAGVAGGLMAFLNASLSPNYFAIDRSIEMVAMVVLGGTGSLSGPIVAAGVLTALPEVLRMATESGGSGIDFGKYRLVLYSSLLISMMILRPSGLLGGRELSDLFRRAPPKAA